MKKENTSKKKNEVPYEVPLGGSLGLLALGHRGLVAWREALKKHMEESKGGQHGKKKS